MIDILITSFVKHSMFGPRTKLDIRCIEVEIHRWKKLTFSRSKLPIPDYLKVIYS